MFEQVEFEQQNRVNGSASHLGRITVGNQSPHGSERDSRLELPQVMIRRNQFLEDDQIKGRRHEIVVFFQHPALSGLVNDSATILRLVTSGNFLSDLRKAWVGMKGATLRIPALRCNSAVFRSWLHRSKSGSKSDARKLAFDRSGLPVV